MMLTLRVKMKFYPYPQVSTWLTLRVQLQIDPPITLSP